MNIIVTGANGYIGKRLVKKLLQNNNKVFIFSRNRFKNENENLKWFFFDINDNRKIDIPKVKIDVIFHLAINKNLNKSENDIKKSIELGEVARNNNSKYIFISSQSSSPNAPTKYGRLKWNIEQKILRYEPIILRPGLVYGGEEEGLYGNICNILRKYKFVPSFFPQPNINPIHIDDCIKCIINSINLKQSSPIFIYSEKSIAFRSFLEQIIKNKDIKKRIFFPFPQFLILMIPNFLFKLNLLSTFEKLQSLFLLPAISSKESLDKVGVSLKPFIKKQDDTFIRKELIIEAKNIFKYLEPNKTSYNLIKRYVYFIEKFKNKKPLSLPKIVNRYPFLIIFLENSNFDEGELNYRINICINLLEATPNGSKIFLGLGKSNSIFKNLFRLFISLMKIVIFNIINLTLGRLILFFLKKL